jgi:hypothetical protein
MKNQASLVVYLFFTICVSPFGAQGLGEETLAIGASSSWQSVTVRNGVTEIISIRPNPVLVLASALGGGSDPSLDMSLSFDEPAPEGFKDSAGRYRVTVSEGVAAPGRQFARIGMGAALFSGTRFYNLSSEEPASSGPLLITPAAKNALFASGRSLRDFSIEFWFFPMNMENGEHILSWTASRRNARGLFAVQRIQCSTAKNRLQWNFSDFFDLLTDENPIALTLEGSTPLVPKTWSHHLIRFDADTGLLEYIVNGQTEDIRYAALGGREGGQILYPVIGDGGSFVLGSRFMGMIDEFKLYSRYIAAPDLRKYPQGGGRIETKSLDLGEPDTEILKIEADGGKTSNIGGILRNEFVRNGGFRFTDQSMVQFFARAGENPYRWDDSPWRPFTPGAPLTGLRGRYVQVAAVFYPSGDGETTPYLDEIRIIYRPNVPPPPPALLVAAAHDGGVDLTWRASPDTDILGYLVYYGPAQGEYFGEEALLGASPIDAGKRTSLRIDGLVNGTLYYFTVAAYDRAEPFHIGPFSREVSARPLRTLE